MRRPLFDTIVSALTDWAWPRKPNVTIGGKDDPYLFRWHMIPRNGLCNVYLHYFMRSDDDRALHDHPYANLSLLLWGSYTEHTIEAGGINVRVHRRSGTWKLRRATDAHRIELTHGHCWTLFITGPRLRDWGFHCSRAGWVSHERYAAVDADGSYVVGAGCGEP